MGRGHQMVQDPLVVQVFKYIVLVCWFAAEKEEADVEDDDREDDSESEEEAPGAV